jgi:SAM-dependent methyltransferase
MNVLRPSAEEAAAAWRELVIAEREQTENLPDRPRPEDFYGPVAQQFKADPHRTDEPILDLVRGLVRPDETWIDIGAGGGRYTLAIALLAKRVYAVEPSAGMRSALAEAAKEYGIENIDVFDERWPGESTAPVADVAFISHVGYDIADFGAFLDEMDAHATRLCVDVMYSDTPLTEWAHLWKPVHSEDRNLLPGGREMLTLLFARGKTPEVQWIETPRRVFESLEALHEGTRRPLWVLPGTEQDARLAAAVREMAVKVDGGYMLHREPRRMGVITWRPRD